MQSLNAAAVGNFIDNVTLDLAAVAEFVAADETTRFDEDTAGQLPRVRVSGTVGAPVTLPINVTGGTATPGVDFTPVGPASITIPAGTYDGASAGSLFEVPYAITEDTSFEADETIVFSIGTPSTVDLVVGSSACDPTGLTEATHTIVNDDMIEAFDDTPDPIDGGEGGTIPNVVANDTLAGVANPTIGVDITLNATGTAQDGTTVLGLDTTPAEGSITLDAATGALTIAPRTTPGTYTYTYEICEVATPTSCSVAQVAFTVNEPRFAEIDAIDDAPDPIDGAAGATVPNVVGNDTMNGTANPAIGSEVLLNVSGTAQDGTTALGLNITPAIGSITLDPETGTLTVAPGTTAGTYLYTYELCEADFPDNCDTAVVTLVVGGLNLISRIEDDLTEILEEDFANTLARQSDQISGYSADALDRLRDRDTCLADVNARLSQASILFDTDKAVLTGVGQRVLDDIAAILKSCPGSAFEISGHTDSEASEAYNLALSQRRVDVVLRGLAARGVDITGFIARGYGEAQPIASNATAAGRAQNRRVAFRPLTETTDATGPCAPSFELQRNFNLDGDDDGVVANGRFLSDQHDCALDRREVWQGTFSFTDTKQGQAQSAIDMSYRREQYFGDDSVFGFFVGLYGSQSEVTRRATGEILGLGANAGIYGANRLQDSLFINYYLGAAAGRHQFDLDFARSVGTINATGDYRYVAGFAGAALSGEIEAGKTTIAPRLGVDYVYSPGADVDVLAQLGALSEVGTLELDAISGGRVFAEFRTDRPVLDGTATLWLNPRLSCYQSLGSLHNVCGVGGSLGIESVDEASDLTYTFEIDGEWSRSFVKGSVNFSASRQYGPATLSGNAGLTSGGNLTLGANVELGL